jgi:hypothetical protein
MSDTRRLNPNHDNPSVGDGGDNAHRNEESRLSEVIRSSTESYGTAEVLASGVVLSQLRRNFRLTPTERVEQTVAFVRFVLPLQGALRNKRD